jgi:hypothetical protein
LLCMPSKRTPDAARSPLAAWLELRRVRERFAPRTSEEALAMVVLEGGPAHLCGVNRFVRSKLEKVNRVELVNLLDALEFSKAPPAISSDPENADMLAVAVERNRGKEIGQAKVVAPRYEKVPASADELTLAWDRGEAVETARLWHDRENTMVFLHRIKRREHFTLAARHRPVLEPLTRFARFADAAAGLKCRRTLLRRYVPLVKFVCALCEIDFRDVCDAIAVWAEFVRGREVPDPG